MSYINDDFWSNEDIFAPPVDTTPTEAERKAENKRKAIEICPQVRYYWNVKTQSMKEYLHRCKYYDDCEKCRIWKRGLNKERLDKLYGKPVIFLSLEEEKKFKKDKTKEQYLRIPMKDGTIGIVIEKRNDWSGEVQWLKDDLIDKLSIEAVPSKGKGRVSGKLDERQEPEDPWKEFEPQMLIAYREFEVEWNERLKNAYELEKIVLSRFNMQHGLSKTLDNLQRIMCELEQLTEQVVKEYDCEGFHFLQKTLTHVRYSEIEWNLWPNAPD